MADAIFADPRRAAIYDFLDAPERADLDPYLAMADEFGAQSSIDVGCGIGTLACRLALRGYDVVGIDPLELVQLDAGVAQAHDFDDGVVAEVQSRPGW